MIFSSSPQRFMKEALKEANHAYIEDEVPVGAVVVFQDKIIAKAHNYTERLCDTTAHAEMQAITAASEYLGGKYLTECTLYVTLEPCPMCAGALAWTQLGELVFGAYDHRKGYTKYSPLLLHKRTKVLGGILQEECTSLIQDFFKKKRY